ncbi:DNA-protecting protein DprA [Candidatus Parcubacteria bacterium]|nr:MAG: DNA-protecting protein DprA [Candidatus Parcubacteria bacterium]
MSAKDAKYWLAVNETGALGANSQARLFNFFKSMKIAFTAPLPDLLKAGIKQSSAQKFIDRRAKINPDKLWQIIREKHIKIITLADKNYPPLLKTIYDPPALLYLRGNLPQNINKYIAIIGSRRADFYGIKVAKKISSELAEQNFTIVSGLAYGIDELAHKSAINHKTPTIAVLGFGVLYKGTQRQQALINAILKSGGAIISEFPLFAAGLKHHYPIRNRIISGLCRATIIIQAAAKSGSLITAQTALEQGREIFAVPGPITSLNSAGTNQLIKDGAHPLTCLNDIFDVLKVAKISKDRQNKNYSPKNQAEKIILNALSRYGQLSTNQLICLAKLPTSTIMSALSILELKNIVHKNKHDLYTKQ